MRLSASQRAVLDRLVHSPREDWISADGMTRRLLRRDQHNVARSLDSLVQLGLAERSAAGLRLVYRATEKGRMT